MTQSTQENTFVGFSEQHLPWAAELVVFKPKLLSFGVQVVDIEEARRPGSETVDAVAAHKVDKGRALGSPASFLSVRFLFCSMVGGVGHR